MCSHRVLGGKAGRESTGVLGRASENGPQAREQREASAVVARSGQGSRATQTSLTGYFQFPMELNCKSKESVTVCCLPGRGESCCSRLKKKKKKKLNCPFPNKTATKKASDLEGGFRALSSTSGCRHLLSLPARVTLGKSLPPSGPLLLHPEKEALDTMMLEGLSNPEMLAFGNKVGCGKI